MANSSKITSEYIDKLIRRYDSEQAKEDRNRKHKQLVKAGKELVLTCLWISSLGAKVEGDLEIYLASFLNEYPEELKEALEYYNKVKEVPAIGKALITGFAPSIVSGELQIHFNWNDLSDKDTNLLIKELKQRGMQ